MLANRLWRYPVGQLRTEMDRLFEGFFDAGALGAVTFPPINAWEENDALKIEAEIPGYSADEIDISVVGAELTLRGTKPAVTETDAVVHHRERVRGDFTRTIKLPFEVDASNVQADLRDGVLLVTLPKAEEARPRKIEVRKGA